MPSNYILQSHRQSVIVYLLSRFCVVIKEMMFWVTGKCTSSSIVGFFLIFPALLIRLTVQTLKNILCAYLNSLSYFQTQEYF